MRTRIYIDGYNLYYGCLKDTSYKWLNLVHLFENHILPRSGEPTAFLHENIGIKFFTAEISAKVATDHNSINDQRSYHQALYHYCNANLETIKGNYAVDQASYPLVESDQHGKEKEPKDSNRVKVWKLEEKQSDVNVAIEAVYDAITDNTLEQIIFVTNDTDIVPALKKIREHNHTGSRSPIKIGLIIPSKENDLHRRPNKSLSELSDWTVRNILDRELYESQLPSRIVTPRSVAIKPTSWFKLFKEVEEILNILTDPQVLKTIPRAWTWLSKEVPIVDGLPILTTTPDKLLDCENGIKDVLKHVKAFSDYKRKR